MEAILITGIVVPIVLIGMPWLIFHYITKWKSQAVLTGEDERMLDELHEIARRLDERMSTVERIMTAENPNWRSIATDNPLADEPRPERLQPRREPFESPSAFEPRVVSNRPGRSFDE